MLELDPKRASPRRSKTSEVFPTNPAHLSDALSVAQRMRNNDRRTKSLYRRKDSRSSSPRTCSNDLALQLKNLTINAPTTDTFLSKMYNAHITHNPLTLTHAKHLLHHIQTETELTTIYNAFNVPISSKITKKSNISKLIVILQSMSLVSSP
jgi:hypothetical protein